MNITEQQSYIGIDVGKSGAIAILHPGADVPVEWVKLSETERDVSDWLLERLHANVHCYIEKVASSPQMGVKSSFTFGQSLGFLRGLLIGAGVPFESIRPQQWQKAMQCMSKGDKNVTKSRCQELFPGLKITHACADAILLAEYCRRTRQGELESHA